MVLIRCVDERRRKKSRVYIGRYPRKYLKLSGNCAKFSIYYLYSYTLTRYTVLLLSGRRLYRRLGDILEGQYTNQC